MTSGATRGERELARLLDEHEPCADTVRDAARRAARRASALAAELARIRVARARVSRRTASSATPRSPRACIAWFDAWHERFTLIATDGAARAGVLHTAHGDVPTPAFMPVGTKAT